MCNGRLLIASWMHYVIVKELWCFDELDNGIYGGGINVKGKNGASYNRVEEIRVAVHEVRVLFAEYRYIDMHLGLFTTTWK